MVSKALQAVAEEVGFTYVEKTNAKQSYLYGIYGDYLITLHDSGNEKTAFINYYLAPNDDSDDSVQLLELSEELKSFAPDFSVVDYGFETDGMFCTTECSVDSVFALLDRLIEVLKGHEISGVERCSSCGNKIGKRLPKKLAIGKKNFLLCEHCALEQMEEQTKGGSDQAPSLPKKTLLGIVGAVVGGLIGILLYFLLYANAADLFSGFEISYVFCLLGFATAFLVYQGFKFFSKQPCTSAYAIVGSVTVVCVAIGQYLGSFASNAASFEFTLSEAAGIPAMWLILLRSTAPENVEVEEPSAMFYKLLCFSLLFAIIGVIIFLLEFYEKAKVKKEAYELTTLRI